MTLDLRDIFEIPGESLDIDYKIMPEETSYLKNLVFSDPIFVKGQITNRSGMVRLNFNADFEMNCVCDRCLKEFRKSFSYKFNHYVLRSLANESDEENFDSYIVADKDHIELNDIVLSDIILEMPSKTLCKEDCKGLCPVCGKNLNDGECDCRKNQEDENNFIDI